LPESDLVSRSGLVYSPCAMTLRFNLRAPRLLFAVAIFFICALAATPDAVAQLIPKATGRAAEPKSASARRERRKIRQTAPAASKTPASIESDNFLDLGDRFREKEKWNAAEAAYKEAIKVWPGNADALSELGYLYLDTNKMDEAQQTLSRLRAVNSSYAAELQSEINRRRAQR
jgi:tetratricopeptide (TPR) repeat protein